MRVHEMSAYAATQHLDTLLHEVVNHPDITQPDKAVLLRARLLISEVRGRHMPKRLPLDPATLPQGRVLTFAPVSGKGVGWLGEWEGGSEAAS
jgi:hypothetical protein